MFFVYNVPNMNPAVGVAKDGKQAVSVYDRGLGNRRTVITTPEEADAFVTARKEVISNATKQGYIEALFTTIAGAGFGAGVNAFWEHSKTRKLNELVDKLNPEFKTELAANKNDAIKTKMQVLARDAYKEHEFKLRNLFSEEAQEFVKIDMTKALKKAGMYGAAFGALTAAFIGLFIPAFKAENADKKITEAFINNNKFEKPEVEE